MHEEYLEWMAEESPNSKPATLRQYRDVFNFEFNLSFFLPKKDQCDDCVTWSNTPEDQRAAIQSEHEEHMRNKDIIHGMQIADTKVASLKTSTSLAVSHFDYEKTLICPKANSSVFYYKRKLSVSNFTIVDVGRFEDCCYVYDESVAKKGSDEVASFLYHFIQRKVAAGAQSFDFIAIIVEAKIKIDK